MRKSLLFLVICCISALNVFSQATSATAITVTPVAYTGAAPTTTNYSLVLGSGQTFNTCVGSQSVYWFKFNIPVPGISTNGTRSVKITANSGAFSPVIDFYDASVVYKECVTSNIMRTTPTTNPIIPGNWYYFRVSSTALATGLSFTLSVEYYPVAEVRSGFYPSVDADGYGMCDQIKRNNLAAGTATNSRFRIVPINSPNYGSCTATVLGNNTIATTNMFTCACFGIDYDCYVEVQMDGHWCGESLPRTISFQDYPTTNITSPTGVVIPMDGQIQANFACNAAIYEWQFTGQNGTNITFQSGANSYALLDDITCLRYNRFYQVLVRVKATCNSTLWSPWCGISGPNTSPFTMFTPQMPTITIPSNMCNTIQPLYNLYFDVDYIPNVDRYYFQKTRVTATSPYTPISAPVIVYSSNSGWLCQPAFSIFGSTANTTGATYRSCFKPAITSCNSPQEGNWGPYCYYAIAPATAPSGMTVLNEEDVAAVQVLDESISENPEQPNVKVFAHGNQKSVLIDMKGREMSGNGIVNFYNLNGQLVYTEVIPNSTGVSEIQLGLPTNLADGTYVMHVISDAFTSTAKMVLSGNYN